MPLGGRMPSPGLAGTPVLLVLLVLGVLALVFLVLWLLAWARLRRVHIERADREWDRIDRELDLAEQQGRLRIVRELQQVAVRSVSALVDEADGAGYAARADPETAGRALGRISERGRAALEDMRRVLTVAREGENVASPMPSLPSARDLVQVMSKAGLEIDVEETGERFALRRGAELAVFRILQGCLENALKHGGPGTRVRVGFTWTAQGLTLVIGDDGIRATARRRGLSPDEVDEATSYSAEDDLAALTETITGAGISEMRTRAELFGGTLNAGPVPGVGFTVTVAFPSLRFHNGIHGVRLGGGR